MRKIFVEEKMHNQCLKESIYALLSLGYLVIPFPLQLTLFIQAPQ
ncbi:hypothetical protein ARAF_1972 [Arsenophonus endosymbiont of Aleurodicus floccissimus]|nr:hypothetical protein [Arsenophonus endosymbiont of Aleurodicus floccissimus]SPP32080.1 hypothetical protein ARAF_1972 [Arsenophonus endosymbiont of Aleurodicus floccissimus]